MFKSAPNVTDPVPLRPWERASRRFQWTKKSRSGPPIGVVSDQVMERNQNLLKYVQYCIFMNPVNTAFFLQRCIGCFDLCFDMQEKSTVFNGSRFQPYSWEHGKPAYVNSETNGYDLNGL